MKRLTGLMACFLAFVGCSGGNTDTIVKYGRDNSSGTYLYFKEHVLKKENFDARVQTLQGTAAIIQAVSRNKRSIGYGGIGYAEGIKILKVKKDAESPAVEPSLENVVNGAYPISRYLNYYTVGEPTGAAKHYIQWTLSKEGQKICGEVGYYPLPEDQQASDPGKPPKESARITVKGSDTMVILGQRWAEHYGKRFPHIEVQVTGGGSGTGIKALTDGQTDICQASRPMKDGEKKRIRENHGKDAVEFSAALDGLAVFVHKDNPIEEITLAQLKDIYTGVTQGWGALGSVKP